MKPIPQAVIAAALASTVFANNDTPTPAPIVDKQPPTTQPAAPPPAPAPPVVPPAPISPVVPIAPPVVETPSPPPASPAGPEPIGLNDILRGDKLPILGKDDAPFSGKLTLTGDDGTKREIVYVKGKMTSRVEWHQDGAVKVESVFENGEEVKRTGWRGENKWFEITFAVEPPPATTPETPVAPTPPVAPVVPTVPPVVPEAPNPVISNPPVPPIVPDPPRPIDPTQPEPPKPAPLAPVPAPVEPDPKPETPKPEDTAPKSETAAAIPTSKPKWPAFVPGNPDRPTIAKPVEAPPEVKPNEPEKQPIQPGNIAVNTTPPAVTPPVPENKTSVAIPVMPKLETGPTKPTAIQPTPTITPLPKSVGPPIEIRADHLVYRSGSGIPYTGMGTLFDETGKKMYEGHFYRGRRQGEGREWYSNGQKKSDGHFRQGSLYEGALFWYYIGTYQKKMVVEYKAGKVSTANLWNRDGSLRW